MNVPVYPPDLQMNLKRLKDEIFADLNCLQIGKITKFDKTTQSAEIEIQCKRRISETQIIDYPPLVDCPVFFLQGGGAYLEMPVQINDYCLVLFSDRDIDIWFSSGNKREPNTRRKHNISDGIALVGLNPSSSVLTLDNDKVQINAGNYPIVFKTTSGKIEIAINGNITLNNGTEAFVLGTSFMQQLNIFLTIMSTMTPGTTAQNAACLNQIKSGAIALMAQLSNLISTQIKGM
jgi:hypothetical protein